MHNVLFVRETQNSKFLFNITHQKYIFSSNTQSTIFFTSFQRSSILFEHIKITKNYKFLPLINLHTEAAKQGPALGVIPVFIPDHPCFSILFVFSHFKIPSLSTELSSFYCLPSSKSSSSPKDSPFSSVISKHLLGGIISMYLYLAS